VIGEWTGQDVVHHQHHRHLFAQGNIQVDSNSESEQDKKAQSVIYSPAIGAVLTTLRLKRHLTRISSSCHDAQYLSNG